MANPQIIKTPSGEELVVLSRAEFDALVAAAAEAEEDANDAAIYDERMADLAARKASVLPEQISSAMLRGDSLLKAVRKWRGISQTDLAQSTGLGQGYLSDLEARRRKGTPETLTTLAKALDVDPTWLLPS
jgi:ribosome-binding protein aMBF1 (putative translation factor)